MPSNLSRRRSALVALAAGTSVTLVAGIAGFAGGSAGAAGSPDLTVPGGATRVHGDQSKMVRDQARGGRARNVIVLIGDGMGDSEITAARNYAMGAAGRFPGLDALPMTGQYTTFSLTKDGRPDYVTDSAASGSGWATGTKTYDGAIGVDIHGRPQTNLIELAQRGGMRTGNVSTAEIEDATPAVEAAHVTSRKCYGPTVTSTTCPTNALEKGGKGSIAEQLLNTRADVTLGGGAATFAEKAKAGRYAGMTLRDQAQARGYQLPTTAAQLAAVKKADRKHPVLGLFGAGNLPVEWTGPAATKDGATKKAVRCTPNPEFPAAQPRLADMTRKAISLLNNAQGSKKGFFLQVEGASIDKKDHAADACGQIGETVAFDAAVKAALDFAKRDGNTLVVATADHGHTSQIVETGAPTPGLTTTLLTNEGSPMTINYATAAEGESQEHTGTQVRIAAYGPHSADVVGLSDQTDLHYTVRRALGLR